MSSESMDAKREALLGQKKALEEQLQAMKEQRSALQEQRSAGRSQRLELRRQRRGTEDPAAREALDQAIENLENHLEALEDQADDLEDQIEELEEDLEDIGELLAEMKKPNWEPSGWEDSFQQILDAVSAASQQAVNASQWAIHRAGEKLKDFEDSYSQWAESGGHSQKADNVSFGGSGTLSGGDYGNLRFGGSGHIAGDVTCTGIRTGGSLHSDGNVDCRGDITVGGACAVAGELSCSGQIKCAGSLHVDGATRCAQMQINGSLVSGGNVEAQKLRGCGSIRLEKGFSGGTLKASGSFSAQETISAKEVELSGASILEASCEAERFLSFGYLEIADLLNAETAEIHLNSRKDSTIGSIGCANLIVRAGEDTVSRGLSRFFGATVQPGRLIVDTIEGDTIYLENTQVQTLRGANVTIGPNCVIGTVEYTGSCQSDPSSTVENSVKV